MIHKHTYMYMKEKYVKAKKIVEYLLTIKIHWMTGHKILANVENVNKVVMAT